LALSSLKKKENSDLWGFRTTTSLKGLAVLLLIFGHISVKCLKEKMLFNSGGYWAVIIFLFISGYGLYTKYQFNGIKIDFWRKRIVKIYIPLWITLIIFITLDMWLVDLYHPPAEIILNIIGIHFNGMAERVNAVAWFVEFVMVLYFIFWLSSKLQLNENGKLFVLFILCSLLGLIVNFTPIRNYHSIWIQYTLVFPVGVAFGKYRQYISNKIDLLGIHPAKIAFALMISFTIFYYWEMFLTISYLDIFRPLALIVSIILLINLYARISYESKFLIFLGTYAYEIYLLHGPFMVKYDFFLFREPLHISFFFYFSLILILAFVLAKFRSVIAQNIDNLAGVIDFNRKASETVPQKIKQQM
jgi:peptidoglycan/LPS O-acetylase OafA/YrhL